MKGGFDVVMARERDAERGGKKREKRNGGEEMGSWVSIQQRRLDLKGGGY